MAQRNSGYDRKHRDYYPTPPEATRAVIPYIHQRVNTVLEPASGPENKMAKVLADRFTVISEDIIHGLDFLKRKDAKHIDAIITNPPYERILCQEFIEHALKLMEEQNGIVAMLLRVDYDSAKTRQHLFHYHSAWFKKIVLTERIVWFREPNGKPKKSPSENHAWYIWDWQNRGLPTIGYTDLID